MKKVVRLTESDLIRLVKKVIKEQSQQRDWNTVASTLEKLMDGLNTSKDEEQVHYIIYNTVNNQSDWNNLQKAFGTRNGENLMQWLKGDLSSSDYNKLLTWINNTIAKGKKEDSMYNPGSKIRLITNRQFIIGRAYNYSGTMGNKEELELDISNSTVVRRDSDGIVVKVPSLSYYTSGERQRGGSVPPQERLSNVCLKIKFSDIIEWNQDTLQIRWFSDFVKGRIVSCS